MGIITISRGTKSGGLLLAEALGERLGCRVASRGDVLAGNPGLQALENELWEEMNNRPPHLWDSLESLRNAYICILRASLMEYTQQGPLIYHANGGQLLLKDTPGLLRVRVVAPMAKRLDMVMERRGGTKLEASRYIHEKDENRTMWNRFLYGVESLADCVYYDQVVNLEVMSVTEATGIVERATTYPCFRWLDEDRQAIDDIALATRVKSILMQNFNTRMFTLDVQADGGTVTVTGRGDEEAAKDEISRICLAVPGVENVTVVHE
ncbi:MAG: BON domain-containing protein [bacterium]|nr:BON domain-containing protein [bacterium]